MTEATPRRRETFGASDRLRRGAEFRAVFAAKRRVGNRTLTLYWLDNDLGRPRLGLSVGRRAGNAVARNRIKRVLRDVFRRHRHLVPGDVDLIAIPNDPAGAKEHATALSAFEHLMGKIAKARGVASS